MTSIFEGWHYSNMVHLSTQLLIQIDTNVYLKEDRTNWLTSGLYKKGKLVTVDDVAPKPICQDL
jgi:hypothetical protein